MAHYTFIHECDLQHTRILKLKPCDSLVFRHDVIYTAFTAIHSLHKYDTRGGLQDTHNRLQNLLLPGL